MSIGLKSHSGRASSGGKFNDRQFAMKLLREMVLCFFVVGVVLYLYFVAAGVALLSLCGFLSHRNGPATLHHFTIAANASLRNQTHTTGELQ